MDGFQERATSNIPGKSFQERPGLGFGKKEKKDEKEK